MGERRISGSTRWGREGKGRVTIWRGRREALPTVGNTMSGG